MERMMDRWLLAAGGGVCAILIALNVQLMFSNTRALHEHAGWVSHTREVMGGLDGLLSSLKDAETGQRGFLLTGDERYLEPYNAAVIAIDDQVEQLRRLTLDNVGHQARFPELRERIAAQLDLLARNIQTRRNGGLVAAQARLASDRGKAQMDALRAMTGDMKRDEEGLLEERSQRAQRSYRWALASGVLAGLAALAVVIAFVALLHRHHAARVQAAAALHGHRELLRVTLASIGDAIITTDMNGRVTYLNAIAEELTGWTSDSAQGVALETVFNIVNEDTRRVVENPALRALREGVIVGLANHTILIARDGTERPVDDSASPIRDESGKLIGCVLVFRDVSERRDAERQIRLRVDQLADADRRKDEFLATLAHELRNPLAPLSNAMAILRRAGNDEALFARTREMMERQLHQMVRLIDDLLDVSRISRGKLELRVERAELAPVIRHAIETCRPMAAAARHEIEVVLPEAPVFLDADPVRLGQIFTNLISNACKFTNPGGHIRVGAQVQGDEVCVTVRDDGIGIPQDKLSEVFELFAQVDRSLEKSHGGLGIGLTLVRRLVGMHGGTVVAASDGPGKGSVFSVRLPLADAGPEAPAFMPVAAPADAPPSPTRVLVVDDNEDSADSLSLFLRMHGNEVAVARDGIEAIQAAAKSRPQVIFLDIGLPKMNGYEVARWVRDQPWGAAIALVALTGWGQEEDRRKGREAGFNHHLVKPVDPDAALELVVQARP